MRIGRWRAHARMSDERLSQPDCVSRGLVYFWCSSKQSPAIDQVAMADDNAIPVRIGHYEILKTIGSSLEATLGREHSLIPFYFQ